MNLHTVLATNNECYIKNVGTKWTPTGVMIHSTAANNPYLKRYVGPDDGLLGQNAYGNTWNQYRPDGKQICCHAFIGKLKDGAIATYQILPWTCKGWNNGGSSNNTHIAIEICEDDLTSKTYFDAVYKEAVEVTAYLCKTYGIKVSNVIDHYEGHALGIASNHGDVHHWFPKFGKSMDAFRKDVETALKAPVKEETGKDDPADGDILYRVQVGAFHNKAYADAMVAKLKAAGYDAFVAIAGDVDGDGKITAADAREALRKATGLK